MSELNMDNLAKRLTDAGFPAQVCQTGGFVATIFADPRKKDEAGDERFALVAGPGSYGGYEDKPSMGDTEEFCFGPDDDGESEAVYLTADDTEDSAVEKMLAYLQKVTAPA